MGDTAIHAGEDDDLEVELQDDDTQDVEKPGDSEPGEDADGEESEAESQEVDIVLPQDDGSQPDQELIDRVISKKVKKLNRRKKEDDRELEQTRSDLAISEEKRKLQDIRIAQLSEAEAPKLPDPDDFDDGTLDPKYQTRVEAYHEHRAEAAAKKFAPKPVQDDEPRQDPELKRRQTAHYVKADKLGLKNYEEVEADAIEILGKDIVNEVIIGGSDNSHVIMYYLGKNPAIAEDITDLMKSDPVKGVLRIGALGDKLKIVPSKVNKNPAPDPDDELEGRSPSRSKGYAKRGPKGATYS